MAGNDDTRTRLAQLRSLLNGRSETWQAGETAMTALPDEEFKRRLGATPPPGTTLAQIEATAALRRAGIQAERRDVTAPAAYDWRNVSGKNFITDIKDQGACGSCVAFGVCAMMEGTLRAQSNDPDLAIDLSEAHLFYCHGREQGHTCDTGWIPDEALQTCKDVGIVDEGCYPYTAGDQNCTGRCSNWQERVHKVTDFHLVSATADMKAWLSTKGPLTACFIVYDDFRYYRSGVYHHASGEQLGGHCVSIVGYDDNAGCWICKNSWGAGWGENGFFKIGYGECAIDTWQVCSAEGITTPQEHDDENDDQEGEWQKNRLVTALWSNDEERNAWIYADTIGWRKLSPASDPVFLNLLTQSAAAKAAQRPVNFREQNGAVNELYVV
jgi:C1A family cysteine protease